jgi:hypothetical protein
MSHESAFPGLRKPRGSAIDRCCDCTAEFQRLAERQPPAPKPVQTRRAYRAAFRFRAQQGQLDLIDLLVPPP